MGQKVPLLNNLTNHAIDRGSLYKSANDLRTWICLEPRHVINFPVLHLKNKMTLDIALEKALADVRKLSPFVAAAMAGCDFSRGSFHLKFFNRSFLIHHPQVKVEEENSTAPTPQWLQVILLHYLLTADGAAIEDQWITYRYLPGTALFEQRFYDMALKSLLRSFGQDLPAFQRSALSLGGEATSRTGDAAFKFLALPHIPMACILYLGDDEVASSINVLFDASAPHYLPTEDLSYLGWALSHFLINKTPTDKDFMKTRPG
ncbi:DUF3786 domain-containing protein [Chloroflexota bacterium]